MATSPLPTEPAPSRLLGCPHGEMQGEYDMVQPSRETQACGGDYKCCDLVVKIKECRKSEEPPKPAPPEPASPEPPETPDLSEDCSEGQRTPVGSLTLQEALEVRKPQFISRSQERLKKLEHMVQQRKAQRKENLGQKQSLFPVRTNKKQFTVPHPLSDNLFKPKERYISEKEMHMRSKRIYNNLPEVKKKKEEQKKRVILQSNRLRAEVFKKVTAWPPAGVCGTQMLNLTLTCLSPASLAITGPAPSKERGLTVGCPADPLPGPGMTSNAGSTIKLSIIFMI